MSITLGTITFDEAHTAVREQYEEVGGRDSRRIEISGLVAGMRSVENIEARLDAILDAASQETFDAALSVRNGRRMFVRRARFSREILRPRLVGTFSLVLEARNAFEESIAATSIDWPVTISGTTLPVSAGGNTSSLPTITLVASGQVVAPGFSDGSRSLVYGGTVGNNKTLVFDAAAGKVWLDSVDVTPYTEGVFLQIQPEGTVLTYSDAEDSSHTASVNVSFHDRWW